MRRVSPLLVGLLFGLGLCLSGMTNAAKVLGFLDLAGPWDPSLAFVMGGAIVAAFPAFRVALRRGRTLAGEPLDLPTATAIDGRLIGGSLLFGVGWGLVGLCPGPAIADIGFLDGRAGAVRARYGRGHGRFRRPSGDPRGGRPATRRRRRLTRCGRGRRVGETAECDRPQPIVGSAAVRGERAVSKDRANGF